ncbi:putative histone-arginine methyltransferase 1.4 [Bienertia sinuspersici]
MFCTVWSRGGSPLLLVHRLHTGTNYAVFSHSLFMSWLDKKLLATYAWLRTITRAIPYILHCQVGLKILIPAVFIYVLQLFDELHSHVAKMWGVGAEQGGILQTSSGKMELKEPYYRMSQPQIQPQAYAVSQDQQPQQLLQQQVPVWNLANLFYPL